MREKERIRKAQLAQRTHQHFKSSREGFEELQRNNNFEHGLATALGIVAGCCVFTGLILAFYGAML